MVTCTQAAADQALAVVLVYSCDYLCIFVAWHCYYLLMLFAGCAVLTAVSLLALLMQPVVQ